MKLHHLILKARSHSEAATAIFFATTNGLHWIQCESSHSAAVAVTAAEVLHKITKTHIK